MFWENPTINTIIADINAQAFPTDHTLVVFIGEEADLDVTQLIDALKPLPHQFMGGVFPAVINGTTYTKTGVVVQAMPTFQAPVIVRGLDKDTFAVDNLLPLREAIHKADSQPLALTLVDGLTKNVAMLLRRMFQKFDNGVKYLGGGAGSLTLQQKPCVFNNTGIYQDAAVIGLMDTQSTIGVRHGWTDMRGPFIANKTDGNVVLELKNQPALQVYRQYVERAAKTTLTEDNFFNVAKGYPLGIFHQGTDRIVRDPIAFDGESLICVGEVPPRSLVYILNGNKDNLIDHARRATREAILPNHDTLDMCLVVDCISRVLYLEEQFNQELDGIEKQLPDNSPRAFGILSLGEIATYGTGRVEFFNKTIVVGTLMKRPVETQSIADAKEAMT